ncbi:MAG: DUF4143 domain-containing protein [bacterium]|nr:DUF4143 domain-containing protein [bacterium]
MGYAARVVDDIMASRLRSSPTVVLEGARGVGKTESARQRAQSEVRFDTDSRARALAELDPDAILSGPEPRLLDEWQQVPSLWNHVRRASDTRGRAGCFILTGSAVPADDEIRHTGAGRISRIRLRPMTLYETGLSNGSVSLRSLLASERVAGQASGIGLTDVIEALCRGGWPARRTSPPAEAQQYVRDYFEETVRIDVGSADGSRRNPAAMRRLLRSMARHTSTEASLASLCADAGGDEPLHRDTVRAYLDALERVFVVEDQPAWSARLRSRSRLRRAGKRHFVDPSLAVAALRAGPERLGRDLGFLGLLFESLVVRDLRVFADACDAEVYHYRDNTGLEVDAVLETAAGEWLAVEVKLGGDAAIDGAARSLLKLRDRVDSVAAGEPTKLIVVTAVGDYSHERRDGVAVVPIGALGP